MTEATKPLDALRERIIAALSSYAAGHPKWMHPELGEQDPNGIHALLDEIAAHAEAAPAPELRELAEDFVFSVSKGHSICLCDNCKPVVMDVLMDYLVRAALKGASQARSKVYRRR